MIQSALIFVVVDMPNQWTRPQEIPYPNVWLRFKARAVESDALVEYRVQDLTEDDLDAVYEHMKTYFFLDEPLNASVRLIEATEAHAVIKHVWSEVIKEKVSLVCYKERSNEVVGCNFLCVKLKNGPEDPEVS